MTVRVERIASTREIGIAGVHEHLLVFLEPAVEGRPVQADLAVEAVDLRVGVEVGDPRTLMIIDPDPVALGGPPLQVFLMLLVDEETGFDVGHRDVVLRVVGHLPHIEGLSGVDDDAVPEDGPNPSGYRLHMVHRDDVLRVVVHHGLLGARPHRRGGFDLMVGIEAARRVTRPAPRKRPGPRIGIWKIPYRLPVHALAGAA